MTKSLEQQLTEAQNRIKLLEAVIEAVTDLLKNAKLYDQRVEAANQTEPPIDWVRVIEVERDQFFSKTSRSYNAMWRLRTDDGRQVNLFDHADPLRDNKPLLQEAGYLTMFTNMSYGDIERWTVSPIEVELKPDGSFWKVVKVKPRVFGSKPDFIEVELTEAEIEFTSSALSRLIRVVKRGQYVILDTETTSKYPQLADIVQIAIIDPTGRVLLDTLVNPGIKIPNPEIHGITDAMVENAPKFADIAERVYELLQDRDVIIYNEGYDEPIIRRYLEGAGYTDNPWKATCCAMEAYAEHVGEYNDYHGGYRWHKLQPAAAAAGYGLPADVKAHSAFGDCLMTLAVCRYLVDQAQ